MRDFFILRNNKYSTPPPLYGIGDYWADFWCLPDKHPLDKRTAAMAAAVLFAATAFGKYLLIKT